ncbi:response regulator transcription factor [Chlamydia sp. 17-3921]|uniref:response regulator transcription factor n=1 Tax=Chlamydia sp. 17-3921 TaxID=2675798 RepID=UPI00191AF746|nr:response regulator transcription factor [Chlamydia sp. 17-3921]
MSMSKTILLVTEDNKLSSQLKDLCSQRSEYQLIVSSSFSQETPAIIIFCEYLQLPKDIFSNEYASKADTIVLFDFFQEDSIIEVLNLGAKGYLLRPFTAKILDAFILASLRHHLSLKHVIPETLNFGDRIFHVLNLTIDYPGGKTLLTPSEAGILKKLLINRGQLCSRKDLLEEIKGNIKEIISRNIDVHIASLRKKLGFYGTKISTVRGVGYLFAADDSLE